MKAQGCLEVVRKVAHSTLIFDGVTVTHEAETVRRVVCEGEVLVANVLNKILVVECGASVYTGDLSVDLSGLVPRSAVVGPDSALE